MPNMSYCRFRNTSKDLNDCMEAIEEIVDIRENIKWLDDSYTPEDEEEMNDLQDKFREKALCPDESIAARWMITDFLDNMLELGIIDEYDNYAIAELIGSIS